MSFPRIKHWETTCYLQILPFLFQFSQLFQAKRFLQPLIKCLIAKVSNTLLLCTLSLRLNSYTRLTTKKTKPAIMLYLGTLTLGRTRGDVLGRLSVKPWCYWLWRLVISNWCVSISLLSQLNSSRLLVKFSVLQSFSRS